MHFLLYREVPLKLFEKSLKTILEEVHFIVNLYNPSSPSRTTSKTLPSSRHMKNSLSVYLFLYSRQYQGKSEEFDNQGMKETRAFRRYSFFVTKNQ